MGTLLTRTLHTLRNVNTCPTQCLQALFEDDYQLIKGGNELK